MASIYTEIINTAYNGFNTRNIDSVFSVMNPDVQWPKAFEGGYVTGFDQVRAYWLRQWAEIDPNVQPIRVTDLTDGTVEVLVHQVVKDLSGIELFNGQVRHIYTIESGLIQRMDIGSDQAVHPSS